MPETYSLWHKYKASQRVLDVSGKADSQDQVICVMFADGNILFLISEENV
jgi:hypothetical protein